MEKKSLLILIISIILSFSFAATIINDDKDIEVIEEQKMLLKSLKSFINDDPTAADEMEYIIQKKEDAARKKMNNLLEQMAKDDKKEKKDELTAGTIDYITRKLNLALVYFYEAKYWLTIQECNNVIKIAPKNTMAWIRRGSGYYMLENYSQAKTDWQLALKLNPSKFDRKDLEQFLAKIDLLIN